MSTGSASVPALSAASLMKRLTELGLIDDANAIISKHGSRWVGVAGRSRRPPDVDARHEMMRLVKQRYPRWSTVMIGQLFDRDHTTVIKALNKAHDAPR